MTRAACKSRAIRGFTLLEILIVGALITLFSGIAIIAVQQMFDENRHKAMYPEAQQIGTALSMAYNAIGFYPRLHTLNQQHSNIVVQGSSNQLLALPHMDTYGYLNATMKAAVVDTNWKGPYSAKSSTRLSQSQRAYVKMRLPDQQTIAYTQLWQQQAAVNIQIVDWPADTWSNPWMVYQVHKEIVAGEPVYRLVRPGTEDNEPDFKNCVVSYGANHVPGGNSETASNLPAYYDFLKNQASLYFEDPSGQANYVLRSFGSNQFRLSDLTSDQLGGSFNYATYSNGTPDPKIGAVGIFDEGTDDVVWEF